MILDAVAALLLVLAGINVVSTSILVYAAWHHRWPALVERAAIAVVLAVTATGFALLGGHRLLIVSLPSETRLAILVVGLLLVSVPSIVWLVAFMAGRFDEAD